MTSNQYTNSFLKLGFFECKGALGVLFYVVLCGLSLSSLFVERLNAASVIPVQIGEWYLEPTVDVTYGKTDSNFQSFGGSIKDNYLTLSPKVRFYNINKDREIIFNFNGKKTQFSDNPSSDNELASFSGEYKKPLTKRSVVFLRGEVESGKRSQGLRGDIETVSPVSETNPERYDVQALMLKYSFYGAKEGVGHNFSVSSEVQKFRFEDSSSSAGRDRDSLSVSAKWKYYFAKDNAFYLNLKHTKDDYLNLDTSDAQSADSQEVEALLGLEWRVRRNIYVEVAAGVTKKRFDGIEQEVEIPSFYGRVEVLLTKLDTVRVDFKNTLDESTDAGISQELREFELSWLRQLTPRLSMEAFIGEGDVSYEPIDRKDRFFRYGLLFDYRMNRTSDIILGLQRYEDDSSDDQFDYNASNIFMTYSKAL